jgi:ubiquinol-cytochrome c reductase iron-sulfur subunit
MSKNAPKIEDNLNKEGKEKRDFIVTAAVATGCAGVAAGLYPFISSLSPSKEVLAVGSTEVDLSNIKEGETVTIMWRGQPIFIKHRTAKEVEEAREVKMTELKDPAQDEDRVIKGHERWLVAVGVCTHLGCVPLPNKGDYDGWLCPCHGSHYDSSARIRKGPAPENLHIPPYEFLSETKIKIG